MSRPIDPQSAVEQLWKMSPAYAKAKGERVYLENFLRSKKAILMQSSGQKTSAAQECYAYARPEYIGLLSALQVAVETEETLRWRLVASQAAIEVWRSQEASARAIDRAAA